MSHGIHSRRRPPGGKAPGPIIAAGPGARGASTFQEGHSVAAASLVTESGEAGGPTSFGTGGPAVGGGAARRRARSSRSCSAQEASLGPCRGAWSPEGPVEAAGGGDGAATAAMPAPGDMRPRANSRSSSEMCAAACAASTGVSCCGAEDMVSRSRRPSCEGRATT